MPDLPSTAAKRESWLKRAINLLIDVRPVTTDGEDDDLFCFTWQIRVTPARVTPAQQIFLDAGQVTDLFFNKKNSSQFIGFIGKILDFFTN